jgi:hypothetical protein
MTFKFKKIFSSIKKRVSTLSLTELFIIASVISLTVFTVKYFGLKKEWRTIRVEIINKNWVDNYNPYGYRTPFWISDKLKIGQKELDKSGKMIAQIVQIENYERGTEEANVYLIVKIKTIYQKRQNRYLYKDQYLDLGSAIELDFDNILVHGQIIDNNVPPEGYPTKNFIITARVRNLEPYLYNKIHTGQKFIDRTTQEPVAEILSVNLEKPTLVFFGLSGNTISIQQSEENRKDVILKIKIKAYFYDNRWYLGGNQNIKLGNSIGFYCNEYNLFGLEIQNVEP